MLSKTEDRYNLQIKVEDISDVDDDGNENKQDEKLNSDVKMDENIKADVKMDKNIKTDAQMDKNVKTDVKMDENIKTDVIKDEYIKSGGNECNLDDIAEEVQGMMIAQSKKKISRLQLILQLLDEEIKEQSMGMADDDIEDPTVKPTGGSEPIHKMSETDSPHGSGIDQPKLDTPTGGSMQIVEMSDKPPKPADGMAADKSLPHSSKPAGGSLHKIQQTSSEEMDGKGSTPQGTEIFQRNQHCIVN